ncbi:conserved hypothetical protein [[Clostridium] ultunense Esp]|nr:conserved hypothetical protein [[Clostridium] ultunense Esp]
MRLRRSELERAAGVSIPLSFSFPFQEKVNDRGVLSLLEIHFSGEALYTQRLVKMKGELRFDATLACSRCLKPLRESFTIPIQEYFAQKGDHLTTTLEEDEINRYSGDEIDLLPPLKEWVLLSLPPYPLCSPDCKGLCPICGANRNEKECGCETDQIDPRLADLAKFFEK